MRLDAWGIRQHNSYLIGRVDLEIPKSERFFAVARHAVTVLGYDDLVVGDEWESPARTITAADVVAFAGLSGDFNAIHVDYEKAAKGPFRKPIAHGLLGLSIGSGLSSCAPRMDTQAFLSILEWKFLEPILFGDTIRVVSTVVSIEPRSRGRRALVTWRRRLINQDDNVVQEGLTQTIVRARRNPEAPADSEETA